VGLPASGTSFLSATGSGVSFQLQPYTSNNVLFLPEGGTNSGTLTLTSPERLDTLSFLAASTIGPAPATVTLNFTDGTTTTALTNVAVPDWFSTTTAAYAAGGRASLSTVPPSYETDGTNPRLYEFDYSLSNTDASKVLSSVSFTNNSTSPGDTLGIFALSGNGGLPDSGQFFNNDVNVTADSTIQIGGAPATTAFISTTTFLNQLTIGNNTLHFATSIGVQRIVIFNGVNLTGQATLDIPSSMTVASYSGTGSGGITKNGAGTFFVDGENNYAGPTIVNAGTFLVNSTELGLPAMTAVTINTAGQMILNPGTGVQTISALTINGNGTLDIGNNHLFINYGSGADPIGTIKQYLKQGYNGGAWNGLGGIDTSAAQSFPSYSLGYADSADPGNPAGLASGQIEIKFTLLGDANLDGAVNGSDFAVLAANFNKAVNGWDQGDFNYDGSVNGADFADLAANFNKGASQANIISADATALSEFAAANGLLADVPEPASTGLLGIGAVHLLSRRRRRQKMSSTSGNSTARPLRHNGPTGPTLTSRPL
jgi:autotransporter-associated beta strand protein